MLAAMMSAYLTIGVVGHGSADCGVGPLYCRTMAQCPTPHCRTCSRPLDESSPAPYDYRREFNYPWSVRRSSLHSHCLVPDAADEARASGPPRLSRAASGRHDMR